MIRRRLVPLVLLVTALLAVVALTARGRPLGASGGTSSGLPRVFWDYVFTSVVIVLVLAACASLAALYFLRPDAGKRQTSQTRTARALAILLVVVVLLVLIGRHLDLNNLRHPHQATTTNPLVTIPTIPHPRTRAPGSPAVHFQWEELAVILGVLLALGGIVATRRRLRPGLPRRSGAPEALAAALDDSLDDLRAERDVRRAIVAAYARMEAALGAAGLPRRPAEAPLEYLERTLLALDTSAGAVRRLTDLFEWARFSHHEPEAAMRDEAIDALVAVRDELRAGERVTV